MVAATSIKAWFEINLEGITSDQQKHIYRIISMSPNPMTRKEVSEQSSIEPGAVGGRVNALVESGYLKECPARKCKVTGRCVGTLEAK